MRRVLPVAMLLLTTAAACSLFREDDGFAVQVQPPLVELRNGLGKTVYFAVLEASAETRLDYTLGTSLFPGERVVIALDSIPGFGPAATDLAVVWSTRPAEAATWRKRLVPIEPTPASRRLAGTSRCRSAAKAQRVTPPYSVDTWYHALAYTASLVVRTSLHPALADCLRPAGSGRCVRPGAWCRGAAEAEG